MDALKQMLKLFIKSTLDNVFKEMTEFFLNIWLLKVDNMKPLS